MKDYILITYLKIQFHLASKERDLVVAVAWNKN